MTTITKEEVKAFIEQIESDLANGWEAQIFELKLARIALASLDAEPVAYIFKHPAGELFWALTDKSNKGQNDVIPVYAVPPASVTGIYDDVLNIIGLLENNEWAEHCTSTVLGSLLESEITRLVSKEQPAPVVPEELSMSSRLPLMSDQLMALGYVKGWSACREAMLQGGEPVSQTYKLNELSGNSPVIPDGWVMVPVDLTPDMRDAYHNAQEEYESLGGLWSPDHQWKAMLAAAPQQEVK